ncbi:MAG: hypothetical protein ACIAS6_10625 [Phycisphaerales bacterium JB060]
MPPQAFFLARAMTIAATVFLAACGESPAPQTPTLAPDTDTTPAQPRTELAAVEAFNAYRLNASVGNGRIALDHVHPTYFDAVQRHIDLALDAEREEVEALPFADRYAVFSMRVRVEPQTLRTITPRAFAELAIDEGWIETEIMAAAMVESVELLPEGSSRPTGAEITVSLGGRTNPSTFPMVYENGAWLVDLATLMQRGAASAEKMAEVLGEDADEMLAVALSAKAGKAEIVDVYAPIGRE